MKRIFSWIMTYIFQGDWTPDLCRTPPTREQLKTYQRRARWRRFWAAVVTLVAVWAIISALPGLFKEASAWSGAPLPSSLAVIFLGLMTLIAGGWCIILLVAGDTFERIDPTYGAAFTPWRLALEKFPEVARYQQWLFEHRDQWPTGAEVDAAQELLARRAREQQLREKRNEIEALIAQAVE